MNAAMTKGEREELRRIVKGQFRMLKAEVKQRETELLAEVETRVEAKFRKDDERRMRVEGRIAKIVVDAQTRIDSIIDENEESFDEGARQYLHHTQLGMPRLAWDKSGRTEFRRVLLAEVEAISRDALAQLERQETELLKKLVLGSLMSEEAKTFFEGIPTVAQLVPSSRLAELEKSWSPEERKALGA